MTEKWQEDSEYMSYVADLLETEAVKKLANFVQHMNSTRLEDLFYYDWRTTKFDEGTHAYMHPRIAVKNAEKITELSDLEKDIILKHMWGATIAPPRYKESYIVTMVDKYCAIKEASEPLTESMKEKWQQRFWKKHRTIQ